LRAAAHYEVRRAPSREFNVLEVIVRIEVRRFEACQRPLKAADLEKLGRPQIETSAGDASGFAPGPPSQVQDAQPKRSGRAYCPSL